MPQHIIITGGLGALGRIVVRAALDAGWTVTSIDHGHHEGDALPGETVIGGVDLTDPAAAERAFAQAAEGGAQALVNLAGGFVWQTVADGDPAAWARMHALNLTTTLNACRAARAHLTGGAIVNTGAFAALGSAAAGMGAYTASKAGVHKLTESLAAEWADDRIRVNAVCPSTLDTPANRADMPDVDPATWVHPEDLARVILWLAGEDSAAVTGALVPVTRGRA